MLNKYFLFLLLGILLPLFVYLGATSFRERFFVTVPIVGNITETKNISEPIIFTGDVLLARNIEQLVRSRGNTYPFLHVQSIFSDAKTVIGNFESAILKNHIATPAYVMTFSTDAQLLPLLPEAGFTHMSLANNHSYDYGEDTFINTVTELAAHQVLPFGNPRNASTSLTTTFASGDFTIGLLALNQVFMNMDWEAITQALHQLSEKSDYQVAYVHWGDEYVLKHNAVQEEIAHKLIDSGIDAVVGHHPHVTQDIQIYNGAPIFYSLGNFLFDQYFSVDVQQGLVVRFTLTATSSQFDLIPVSSEGTLSQPHRMTEPDLGLFLKNLARRSAPELSENIATGKVILPRSLATYPQNGMIAP